MADALPQRSVFELKGFLLDGFSRRGRNFEALRHALQVAEARSRGRFLPDGTPRFLHLLEVAVLLADELGEDDGRVVASCFLDGGQAAGEDDATSMGAFRIGLVHRIVDLRRMLRGRRQGSGNMRQDSGERMLSEEDRAMIEETRGLLLPKAHEADPRGASLLEAALAPLEEGDGAGTSAVILEGDEASPTLEADGMVFDEIRTADARHARLPSEDPSRKDEILTVGLPGPEEPLLFLSRAVSGEMVSRCQANPNIEVGGLMLGIYGVDGGRHFVEVRAQIPAAHTRGTAVSLQFTAETWTRLGREQERLHPELRTLGWYHSHPVSGVFFSDKDLFIHRNFFALPWQIAVVVDPREPRLGLFRWRGDRMVACGYRLLV